MMVFILESRVLYLLRIQELLGEAKEMVQISDSPPTGKAVTVSGLRFGSYGEDHRTRIRRVLAGPRNTRPMPISISATAI